MRVARINCSHGTGEEHAERIRTIRRLSADTGIALSVLYDLSGPKIRTGAMEEPVMLQAGNPVVLTTRERRATRRSAVRVPAIAAIR